MPLRVRPDELRSLLGIDADTDVSSVLILASRLVDANLMGQHSDATILATIELMLAAHYWSVGQPQIKSESYGGGSFSYAVPDGSGFLASTWGQQAIALDTSGTLVNLGKRRARLEVI